MLGLGLTQIYNNTIVYNRKRHGEFALDGKVFDFRRSAQGFPKQLSQEFLLVDFVNHLKELRENTEIMQGRIKSKLSHFDSKKLHRDIKTYGKIATQRFFKEIYNE